MSEWFVAFYEIKPIDQNNSGFNLSKSTKEFGFKKEWNLGGDDGHSDFLRWLEGWFSFEHDIVAEAVYKSFLAAKTDPKRLYDKHVLFALDLFIKSDNNIGYMACPDDDCPSPDPMSDPEFKEWAESN